MRVDDWRGEGFNQYEAMCDPDMSFPLLKLSGSGLKGLAGVLELRILTFHPIPGASGRDRFPSSLQLTQL